MDGKSELHFRQLKRAIKSMRKDINLIMSNKEIHSSGSDTGIINLSGKNEVEIIKIFGDTQINPPENITLTKFNVFFCSFTTAKITLEGYEFNVYPKKTYRIEFLFVSNLIGWTAFITEMDYSGKIDIDSLYIWYNASDYLYTSYYDSSVKPVIYDRMCNHNYTKTWEFHNKCGRFGYDGVVEPSVTFNKYYCNSYEFSTYTNTANNNIDILSNFGETLDNFNGDEMTFELCAVISDHSFYKDKPLMGIGDNNKNLTNCIVVKSGGMGSGYVRVYDDAGQKVGELDGLCEKGILYLTVTFSKSMGKAIIYKDGASVLEIDTGTSMTIGNRLLLGCTFDVTGVNNTTVGCLILKDFRLYNKVLSPEQVLSHYNTSRLCEGNIE